MGEIKQAGFAWVCGGADEWILACFQSFQIEVCDLEQYICRIWSENRIEGSGKANISVKSKIM